jgi:mono/diheme cytochrome c family protein
MKTVITVIALSMALAAAPAAQEGKSLYMSEYKCFQCHGPTGVEGGIGPSFKGVGKKYDRPKLLELAAHKCPPTDMCSPKELGAIVDYLLTL